MKFSILVIIFLLSVLLLPSQANAEGVFMQSCAVEARKDPQLAHIIRRGDTAKYCGCVLNLINGGETYEVSGEACRLSMAGLSPTELRRQGFVNQCSAWMRTAEMPITDPVLAVKTCDCLFTDSNNAKGEVTEERFQAMDMMCRFKVRITQ